MNLFTNRFYKFSALKNENQIQKSRTISNILIYSTLIISIAQLINCIILPDHLTRWVIVIVFICFINGSLILLNHYGYSRLSATLFIIFNLILTSIMAYSAGGIRAPVMEYLPLIILMAGLILGWKEGLITGILIVLIIIGYILANYFNKIPENNIGHNDISIGITMIVVTTLLVLLQYYSISSRDMALHNAHKEIEARKKVEEHLRTSEEFRRRVFESSKIPIVVMDTTTYKYIDCNPAAVEIYGFKSKEETLGKKPADVSAPTQYDNTPSDEKARFYLNKALAEGNIEFEWKHQRPDGRIWDAEVYLMSFESDNRLLFQFTLIDITKRRQAEQLLRESEKRLRFISENTADVIWSLDLKSGKFTFVNTAVEKLRGYTPEEVMNQTMQEALTPESYKIAVELLEQGMKTRKPGETSLLRTISQFDQPRKDGSIVPTEIASTLVFDDKGNPIEIIGVSRDITERRMAEEKLKESEQKYRNLFESANDAIFIIKDQRFIDCNIMATQLFGLQKEDLLNLSPWDISPYMQTESILSETAAVDYISKAMAGNPQRFEWKHLHANKTILEMEVSLNKIDIPDEKLVLAVVRDISERKRFEKEVFISTFKGEENERARLAKDLHDGLGPLISACKIYHYNLNQSEFKMDEQESYNKLGELLDESLSTIREISNNLSPHILRNFGLIDAIKNFSDKIKTNIKFEIKNTLPTGIRYDEVIEVTLYRVLIELINNTLKYAKSQNITIEFKETSGEIHIKYADDGIGFNYSESLSESYGFGLLNIRSRIKSINGILNYSSKKNKGVNVDIVINL